MWGFAYVDHGVHGSVITGVAHGVHDGITHGVNNNDANGIQNGVALGVHSVAYGIHDESDISAVVATQHRQEP